MKRFFLISLTVLVAALLMVACNMDSKLDDGLAILSFQASGDELTSKNLTRTNPVLNPEDLWWSYTANKAEDDKTNLTTGSTGETKTAIGNQTQGLKTSVGPFSYGKWVFTLYGYTGSNRAQLAYQGTSTVTISSTKTTISVTVKSLDSGNGTLQIPAKGAIKLKLNNDSDITDYSAFVEKVAIVALDAGSSYKQETPQYIESTSNVTSISLPSGSYSVTVSYQSKKDPAEADSDQTAPIIYAQDTIIVTIADYLTTKIGGDIKENNSQVEFFADGEIIKAKTSETLKSNEATVLTVNAAPISATSETVAETTVSIPEGAITTSGDSTVALEVISYSPTAVSTENDETESGFTITSTTETNPVLGVLDIKLYVGNSDTPTTKFSDSKVLTVTTKVAKGLNGGKDYKTGDSEACSIQVQYNGEGAAGIVTSYNATTGELVFTVSHLSTYYVVDTNAVVYNSTINEAYTTLTEAVTKASNEVSGDSTIILLCNFSGGGLKIEDGDSNGSEKNTIKGTKNITIDFNNHTYTVTGESVGSANTETQAMHWGTKNVKSITLKNGSFVVDENLANNETAKIVMAMQNYIYFTAENMVFDFTKIAVVNYGSDKGNYSNKERSTWGNNCNGTISLKNCTVSINESSNKGICECGGGTTLENTTINGYVSIDDPDHTVTVINSTITKGDGVIVAYFTDTQEIIKTEESNNKTVYKSQKRTTDANTDNNT